MLIELETFRLEPYIFLGIIVVLVLSFVAWLEISQHGFKKASKGMWWLVLILLAFVTVPVMDARGVKYNQETPWEIEMSGAYSHAQYFSTGGLGSRPKTVIHLMDGRTYVLDGNHNIPFKKGEEIRVFKNKGLIKITLLP